MHMTDRKHGLEVKSADTSDRVRIVCRLFDDIETL